MTYVEKTGNLFDAETDAIGHGVNCKGLMGAGIAVQFRNRWPDMYSEYRKLCLEGLLSPGQIYPYRDHTLHVTLVNIASQEYPGPDAKLEWLVTGVSNALAYCHERGLSSLAVPRIGCGIGGLDWRIVQPTLQAVAAAYEVHLEVWSL